MDIKQRKFIKQFLTGFGCHAGERARMFVLTESDKALDTGLEFKNKFKHLIAFIRKRYGGFEYCCVWHRQGDNLRFNYHVIYFGSYIDQKVIEQWWMDRYDSHRSKMELIKYPEKAAKYLSGYLVEGEKFQGAHFSQWWVFPCWWEFGRWFKREFQRYPNDLELKRYSKMNESQLSNEVWYSLFRLSKVKAGKLKPGNEKLGSKRKNIPVYQRVFKPGEYEITEVKIK